jgi:hypothetical protein
MAEVEQNKYEVLKDFSEESSIQLGRATWIQVRVVKGRDGKPMLDIRTFVSSKSGYIGPTKTGYWLDPEKARTLYSVMGQALLFIDSLGDSDGSTT